MCIASSLCASQYDHYPNHKLFSVLTVFLLLNPPFICYFTCESSEKYLYLFQNSQNYIIGYTVFLSRYKSSCVSLIFCGFVQLINHTECLGTDFSKFPPLSVTGLFMSHFSRPVNSLSPLFCTSVTLSTISVDNYHHTFCFSVWCLNVFQPTAV